MLLIAVWFRGYKIVMLLACTFVITLSCCTKNGNALNRRIAAVGDSTGLSSAANPDRTFADLLGVNAFEWDFGNQYRPVERAENFLAFSGVRHYLDWRQIESVRGKYGYNPTLRGGWKLDQIYQWCQENDITALVCLKTIPEWLLETFPSEKRDAENAPAPYGADLADPHSYKSFAELGFQFAARYGRNKQVDPNLVRVSPEPNYNPNEKKIGMGLIQYIECNNEPNRTWKPTKVAYQNAEQYAANLSAFYDGHKNSMGPGVGVKNADSTMVVVMGGITPGDPKFVDDMIEWCRKHRGLKSDGSVDLCFDVINYHSYAHNRNIERGKSKQRGRAPELASTQAIGKNFVDYRVKKGLDLQIWVTEFGYDVNPHSVQRAIPVGDKPAEITQADWNLRAALMYARMGIDRLFFYMLQDVSVNSTTQYASSGFLHKGPRPAWDYFYQAKQLLGDFRYESTLNTDPIVDKYVRDDRQMYVLTIPDEVGRKAAYELAAADHQQAMVYELQVGSKEMKKTTLPVKNGKVILEVSETPIFVELL